MSCKVEKSVQAKRDIEEAFVYIAEENPDVAVYFLVAVEESIERLAEHPFVGSRRRFQNTKLEDLRLWQVKGFEQYLIIYAIEETTVKILRIVNAKRDFDLLFDL